MNEDFYKQRAREVRDIAAKADPFIKPRLLTWPTATMVCAGQALQPYRQRQPSSKSRRTSATTIRARDARPDRGQVESQQKNLRQRLVSYLHAEQTENLPVSPERPVSEGKQKSVRIEAAMGNAEYERARARARLALIAPTIDDVTAAYFDAAG